MSIRNAAKAIIIHDGKVLLNKCHDIKIGDYYCLPGGGQNQYEKMAEAVNRECIEETGYDVAVDRFGALFEVIYNLNNLKENYPDYTHKIYHIFICHLKSDVTLCPTEHDTNQLGCEWIPIEKIIDMNLRPTILVENMMNIINSNSPVFLGSVHCGDDSIV